MAVENADINTAQTHEMFITIFKKRRAYHQSKYDLYAIQEYRKSFRNRTGHPVAAHHIGWPLCGKLCLRSYDKLAKLHPPGL